MIDKSYSIPSEVILKLKKVSSNKMNLLDISEEEMKKMSKAIANEINKHLLGRQLND